MDMFEMEDLDDEGLEEVLSLLNSLKWNGSSALPPRFNNNGGPSKAEMEQFQKDIAEQRLQMTAIIEQSKEMEEKFCALQAESEKSKSEIADLRLLLESERESKAEMEAKITYFNDDIQKTLGSLITRIAAAEESLEVSKDRFTEVNENNERLTDDIQRVKESVEAADKLIQSHLEVSQLYFSKVDEGHQGITVELSNINVAIKQLETRIQPEVPLTPATGKGGDGSDKDIQVITVDDDVEEIEEVAAPPVQENSFTLSSVASKFKASSAVGKQEKRPPPPIVLYLTTPSTTVKSRNVAHALDRTKKGCTCGQKFRNVATLRRHIMYCTSERKFLCSLCPRRFLWLADRRRHQIKAHKISQETFTHGCRKCGKIFKSKKKQVGHTKICNGGQVKEVQETPKATARSPSPKPSTSKSTRVAETTPRHHGRDFARHLYCLCGRKFSKMYNLNSHLMHYTAEKKYVCKPCGKGYTFQCRLKRHFQTTAHKCKLSSMGTSKASRCKYCWRSFRSVLLLAKHMKAVHPIKTRRTNNPKVAVDADGQEHKLVPPPPPPPPTSSSKRSGSAPKASDRFYCQCGTSYASTYRVARHIGHMAKGRQFKCSKCSSRFNEHYGLKRHLRNVHNINYSQG